VNGATGLKPARHHSFLVGRLGQLTQALMSTPTASHECAAASTIALRALAFPPRAIHLTLI
jgi:hypothetical protein